MKKNSIGIFDSGVGGLSIFREIIRLMPYENTIYIADQANLPYSEKTTQEINKRANILTKQLIDFGSNFIVIACNTATVTAISLLRKKYKIPFVGIEPAVKPAVSITQSKEILVLATGKTIRSKSQKKLIDKYGLNTKVYLDTLPNIVRLIEKGEISGYKIRGIIAKALNKRKYSNVDVVVLSCTHYPLIKAEIKKINKYLKIYDPSLAVASQVYNLRRKFVNKKRKTKGKHLFFTTSEPSNFRRITKQLLNISMQVDKLSI